MRIVNPSFGVAEATAEKLETKPVDWLADSMILFSNSKPNARELLAGIKEKLGGVRQTDNIDFINKNSASQPAPAGMIEQVSQNYRVALLALAD